MLSQMRELREIKYDKWEKLRLTSRINVSYTKTKISRVGRTGWGDSVCGMKKRNSVVELVRSLFVCHEYTDGSDRGSPRE